jgi:tetratricopeptide (TPR) repeat protein
MLGNAEEARAAYTAALAVDPHQATALVALLGVQLDTHDLDGAMDSLTRIDRAHLVDPLIDHLRARALVDRAAGESGVARMVDAVGRSPDDGELRFALATLYLQAERWSDAADAFYAAISRTTDRRRALGMRAIALARGHRAPTVQAMLDQLRATVSAQAPLSARDLAMIAVASAWVEWDGAAYGRVSIFARQALDAVPDDPDATLLLAYVDDNAHRDPSQRLRALRDRSIEARGWLASLAATPLDTAGCADARAYLLAAPAGRFAEALGARVAGCPP